MTTPAADPRAFLRTLFRAALAAALPERVLPGRLPPPGSGRTLVLGAGKAAAAMAQTLERHWRGRLEGFVVTRYGHAVPCERIGVIEAGHPVPDEGSKAGAERMLALAQGLDDQDVLLALISGGGSSLLALPAAGLSLADKRVVTRELLRSGAPIAEINCVRKHLSAIKGGRLAAAAHPARVFTYLISDVPGDDPAAVASGPTLPDPTTFADAAHVLRKHGITGPPAVMRHLRAGVGGRLADTPKPGAAAFGRDETIVLARAADALQAATMLAEAAGVRVIPLGGAVQGEARVVAVEHARLALACAAGEGPASPPCLLLSGGETTVSVRGSGRGGRNTEYLLAAALALEGKGRFWGLACDTDGLDGSEDNAGAVFGPETLASVRATGVDPVARLAANDSYAVFAAAGELVVTGPTLTNVNDFRALYIGP